MGATELLAEAAGQLEHVTELDPRLQGLAQRLEALRYESEDVAAELRGYLAELEGGGLNGAGRLEEIEERLALLARLERKHGGTIADVLAHAERCRARRDELENADSALEALEAELAQARSAARRAGRAAGQGAPQPGAQAGGGGPRAAGRAGHGRRPLRDRAVPASGWLRPAGRRRDRDADRRQRRRAAGPAARGRLRRRALPGDAGAAQRRPRDPRSRPPGVGGAGSLLVFDEIDAGIGGHTARAVGEHLRALSAGRQVLCITHLPQVAALADRHFTIVKDGSVTPATTTVTALDGDGVVGELVRMLGGGSEDRAANEHARELLRAA